ncbi:hypothetical protein CDIK_0284 [Cucumispora dikerogammari]|nr:hypothetical protein CDIK_0284 [Cucumispora dikerogammari]
MPIYIVITTDKTTSIYTIKDTKLQLITAFTSSSASSTYLDSLGKIYTFTPPKLLCCVSTNTSVKITEPFNFQLNAVFLIDPASSSYKIKQLDLDTFSTNDIHVEFDVKISNIISFNETFLYFNEDSLVLNGILKKFDFNLKKLRVAKNVFLILDYENKIHLFDPKIMEIDLVINSFKEEVLEIHSNPFTSLVGVSVKGSLTILDLENKKILKKLNITMGTYEIHFVDDGKVVILGDKLILYDLKTDVFVNLEAQLTASATSATDNVSARVNNNRKVFYFDNHLETPLGEDFSNPFFKEKDLIAEIEHLKTLIIEMKLSFSKEIFKLKEKVEKLENK